MPKREIKYPEDLPKKFLQPILVPFFATKDIAVTSEHKTKPYKLEEDPELKHYLEYEKERLCKFVELLDYYGFEFGKDSFPDYKIMKIIFDFVPGLELLPEEHTKKGRKGIWNNTLTFRLWADVDQLVYSQQASTPKAACEVLAEREYWSQKVKIQSSELSVADNLYKQYQKAKSDKPLVQFFERLLKTYSLGDECRGAIQEIATQLEENEINKKEFIKEFFKKGP